MTTIGYGDIVPGNTPERLVIILCALVSAGVFGYILNKIGKLGLNYVKLKYLMTFLGTMITLSSKNFC